MEPIADTILELRLVKTGKDLLRRLDSKGLTFSEFMRECAYWALKDGFDELRPKPYPTKPQQVVEYEALDKYAREKYDWQKLRENRPQDYEVMQKYFEQRLAVKNENKAILERLETIKTNLLPDDVLNQARVQQRIYDFEPQALETFNATQVYA